ncbi:hypothetical protein HMN09_00203000 [Mycena chlorophos]|uniref:DUF6533 domain-containing protein n=1 Tax=Mycena chlorophos TaxID=658473 RepID=A0A8H6WJQ8_MYCCL|nr:hypothetical protein HMN09_00203000 [Mycena chlorophos]
MEAVGPEILIGAPEITEGEYVQLVRGNLIPLYVVLVGLTWVLHDFFVTIEDEVRYIWPQRWHFSKAMYFWIRYYTILLLAFDAIQIHVFSMPGITSDGLCIAMDTIIRVVGAVSLWSVEIIMQLRVYALYNCSKRIALTNFLFFLASIAAFMWILVVNHSHRAAVIADVIRLPLPGCPDVHSGIEWAQWVPATVFEGYLFLFALVRAIRATMDETRRGIHASRKYSLLSLVLRDNVVYFLAVTVLLVFNNLMVVNVTGIPWFSYGPFHAAIGILTTRMLLNLRKATAFEIEGTTARDDDDGSEVDTLDFGHGVAVVSTVQLATQHKWLDINFDFEKGMGEVFGSEASSVVSRRDDESEMEFSVDPRTYYGKRKKGEDSPTWPV